MISGEVFEWGPGDVFVTPSWSSVDHEAAETADLFAISDRPVLQALHPTGEGDACGLPSQEIVRCIQRLTWS